MISHGARVFRRRTTVGLRQVRQQHKPDAGNYHTCRSWPSPFGSKADPAATVAEPYAGFLATVAGRGDGAGLMNYAPDCRRCSRPTKSATRYVGYSLDRPYGQARAKQFADSFRNTPGHKLALAESHNITVVVL